MHLAQENCGLKLREIADLLEINNPAASYLATRSGVVNYQFKRLRV